MSKSDRIIAGIFGVALLSAASVGHYYQVVDETRAESAAESTGRDEGTIGEFISEPAIVTSNEEGASAQGNVDRRQSNQQPWLWFGDGLAQWLMVVLGIAATALSAYAVVLLRKTLTATSEAVRSADDAVAVAREIGQDQLRPWLIPQNVLVYITTNTKIDGASYEKVQVASVVWENLGQSPAINCQVHILKRVVSHGAEFEEFDFEEVEGSATVGQGKTATAHEVFVPPNMFDEFHSVEVDLIVGSMATYTHSLSPRKTSFCDVAYRICRNGERIGQNGQKEPNYKISLEYSRTG